jgi:murein DD-endopeptidase MepM/ murein hydrolase activator NlpD
VKVMNGNPSPSRTRALAVLAASSVAALGLGLAPGTPASASHADPCSSAYGWPVRPFDTPHPIRGNFADPRTRFGGRKTVATLLEGDGVFSFHQGVDISAPDGAPVYPVASGTVTLANRHRVTVSCGNGRSFQYWHIYPSVRAGRRVEVGRTVLGRIQPMREHVHLTHLENGRAVNPLAPRRLTPYRDTTRPDAIAIEIRRGVTELGHASAVSGRVGLVLEAVDTPALDVPGRWRGFPVTPARVTWKLERGDRILLRGVARDARGSVPRNDRFWETFARGTHQNWPIFAGRKLRHRPGRYLFELVPHALDTRRLRDGRYELVATASDASGNSDVIRLLLTIDNGSDL